MNGDIGILRMLDVPFIGKRIAANHYLQSSVFQDKAHRAIPGMYSGN